MAKLIVGLGNPGKQYEKTRHNAGFIALDVLLDKFGFTSKTEDFKGILYTSMINNKKVFLLKPQTFMNLSGESLIQVINFYKIDLNDVIVIYDDKDLDIGVTRFRFKGSAGGHNGVKHIFQQLGTQEIQRLKVGIGNPSDGFKILDWVLNKMSSDEINLIKRNIEGISNFLIDFVDGETFVKIMNKYN